MREQLSTVGHAASPTAVDTTRVTLGRCESGGPWTLHVARPSHLDRGLLGRRQRLRLLGNRRWASVPLIAAGLVHLIGIDLKYGIELSVGARLFTTVATTEPEAVETLAALEKLMDKRGTQMAGRARQHTPTKSAPLDRAAD